MIRLLGLAKLSRYVRLGLFGFRNNDSNFARVLKLHWPPSFTLHIQYLSAPVRLLDPASAVPAMNVFYMVYQNVIPAPLDTSVGTSSSGCLRDR